jgi:serine phosphatase RsbU (regulator of sigma subunit)
MENMETGGIIPKYMSENGTWLSAFHPIRNSEGKVVAILEADISFDEFSEIVKKQFLNQAIISIIVIILLALIFIPFTRQILIKDHEQKLLFIEQNKIISEKNKDIIDSINYALKIQRAILPSLENIKDYFQDYFILFKPKDIVSGDFYWSYEDEENIFLAVADSTGHGVPGSMVSIVCSNALSRAVVQLKLTNTADILNNVKEFVTHSFQDGMNDGMDICFCKVNKQTKSIQYSGAHNSLFIYSNNELTILDGCRQPIGRYNKETPFKCKEFTLKENDIIYLFTDGYYDQFGGERNKKMKIKVFKSLLLKHHKKTMSEQKKIFGNYLRKWQGDNEQLDDITILGIKI